MFSYVLTEARLYLWILQPEQVRIDNQFRIIGGQEFVLLLRIALNAVSRIYGLYFRLAFWLAFEHREIRGTLGR